MSDLSDERLRQMCTDWRVCTTPIEGEMAAELLRLRAWKADAQLTRVSERIGYAAVKEVPNPNEEPGYILVTQVSESVLPARGFVDAKARSQTRYLVVELREVS